MRVIVGFFLVFAAFAASLGLSLQAQSTASDIQTVPDPHKDHKVEARGFLIRRAGGNRINVTSLQTVAAGCSP